jgi:hypothetical protein
MAINPALLFAGSGNASVAFFAPEFTAAPVGVAGTAGVQSVTLTGTPTGGTFTLTAGSQTTTPIPSTATAAQVQTALNALTGYSGITVTGGPGPSTAWVVTFPSSETPVTLTGSGASLTPSGAVAVAVTTPEVQSSNAATAVLGAAWLDAGLIADTGIVSKITESSKAVFAYGITSAIRTLVSQRAQEFDVSFLEFNPVALAIANRKPLGSITPDTSGHFQIAASGAALPRYAGLFDITDGSNKARIYCPSVAATTVNPPSFAPASEAVNAVSLTAYPDSTGVSVYTDYQLAALAH